MPNVTVEQQPTLDLLPDTRPAQSSVSDAPVVETQPDAVQKPVTPEAAPPDEAETPDASATSESEEGDAPETPQGKPKPKGVQKRIDELTRQREESNRRVDQLLQTVEALIAVQTGKPKAPVGETPADELDDEPAPARPDPANYTSAEQYAMDVDKYIGDHSAWVARREVRKSLEAQRMTEEQRRREAARQHVETTYRSRVEKALEKYPDYHQVAEADDLPISRPMADAIRAAESGPDVAYWLGQHPDECAKISKLHPVAQIMELGRIAHTLSAAAPAPKPVSRTPAPITPSRPTNETPPLNPAEESMESYAARRKAEWAKENSRPGRR